MTMGIPVRTLPINNNGDLKLDAHRAWLRYRLHEEATVVEDESDVDMFDANSSE